MRTSSSVRGILAHSEYGEITVNVYIDGVLKGAVGISPGVTIVGVWSVVEGTHTVQIDRGDWYVQLVEHWFSPDEYVNTYAPPDGAPDFAYDYEVGPLYTKNAYFSLS